MSIPQKSLVWDCTETAHVDRSHWLMARKAGIGASEAASIFGVGYKGSSPVSVWHDKVSNEIEQLDQSSTVLIRRGSRMEPVIAAEFEDESGLHVNDPGDFTIFRSVDPALSFMFATVDRIVIDDDLGPVPGEIKNVSGRMWRDWEDDAELPLKHIVQCQHQMAVTGTDHCYLIGLVGGNELKFRLIERNQDFIDAMIPKLRDFWGYVTRNEMPPVDESEATSKLLNRIYPRDDLSIVELPSDADSWHNDLLTAKEKLKNAKAEKLAAENKIKAAIGDATYGQTPTGVRYSWKQQTRKEFISKEVSFRVLRNS